MKYLSDRHLQAMGIDYGGHQTLGASFPSLIAAGQASVPRLCFEEFRDNDYKTSLCPICVNWRKGSRCEVCNPVSEEEKENWAKQWAAESYVFSKREKSVVEVDGDNSEQKPTLWERFKRAWK